MTEARQIKELIFRLSHLPFLADLSSERMNMMAEYLYNNDYRKVQRPPVLTDEANPFRIVKHSCINDTYETCDICSHADTWTLGALAQRDADWKAIWGEE